jgi:hypothetical protein
MRSYIQLHGSGWGKVLRRVDAPLSAYADCGAHTPLPADPRRGGLPKPVFFVVSGRGVGHGDGDKSCYGGSI